MTELVSFLNNISPLGLAFDELAQYDIPSYLTEAVDDYSCEILQNKQFTNKYKKIIQEIICNEFIKRPSLSLRKKVLIKEQIWNNATKNLCTLSLNIAVTHIIIQLQNSYTF